MSKIEVLILKSKVYIKYLGVLIDKNLSWKYHTDAIATKIRKKCRANCEAATFCTSTNTLENLSITDPSLFNLWSGCLGPGM